MKNKSSRLLETYNHDVRTESIAKYYAERFHKRIRDKNLGDLRMLSSCYVELYDSKCKNFVEMMNIEDMESGEFVKFTNNTSYVSKETMTDLTSAYSHFPYELSGGKVIIMDIQGFKFEYSDGKFYTTLTDPVVTSIGGRFDSVDRGELGFRLFWEKQHPACNHMVKL